MDKEDVFYPHTHKHIHMHKCTMEYYSAIENNEMTPIAATWLDLEILSEVSQTEKDKYMISFICGIKKMVQMNLFTKQR